MSNSVVLMSDGLGRCNRGMTEVPVCLLEQSNLLASLDERILVLDQLYLTPSSPAPT